MFYIPDDSAVPLDGILDQDVLSAQKIDVIVSAACLEIQGKRILFWNVGEATKSPQSRKLNGNFHATSPGCNL